MATREITAAERELIDVAWNAYLDKSASTSNATVVQDAWDTYQHRLDQMSVVATLAGYRFRLLILEEV